MARRFLQSRSSPDAILGSVQARHAARTVQQEQTPLAALICSSAGPLTAMGRKLRILTPAGPVTSSP
jgi:hypothetical protein